MLCSPEVVTDLDEKTAEEKEAEGNGAEQASANDFLRQDGELPEAYARRVFKRVFCQDIEKVLSMEVCCAALQLTDVMLAICQAWPNLKSTLYFSAA